ncbi:hypothetical protein D3C87_1281520 [compost metagenome]
MWGAANGFINFALGCRDLPVLLLLDGIQLGIALFFTRYQVDLSKISGFCRVVVTPGAQCSFFMEQRRPELCRKPWRKLFRITFFPVQDGIVQLSTLTYKVFDHPVKFGVFIGTLLYLIQEHVPVFWRFIVKHDGDVPFIGHEAYRGRLG